MSINSISSIPTIQQLFTQEVQRINSSLPTQPGQSTASASQSSSQDSFALSLEGAMLQYMQSNQSSAPASLQTGMQAFTEDLNGADIQNMSDADIQTLINKIVSDNTPMSSTIASEFSDLTNMSSDDIQNARGLLSDMQSMLTANSQSTSSNLGSQSASSSALGQTATVGGLSSTDITTLLSSLGSNQSGNLMNLLNSYDQMNLGTSSLSSLSGAQSSSGSSNSLLDMLNQLDGSSDSTQSDDLSGILSGDSSQSDISSNSELFDLLQSVGQTYGTDSASLQKLMQAYTNSQGLTGTQSTSTVDTTV